MIVGLGHQARVGKDTVAEILRSKYGFKRYAFADVLKDLAYQTNPQIGSTTLQDLVDRLGWEEAKKIPEVRVYLQQLGVGARKVLGVDVWVQPVITKIKHSGRDHHVISDVRFQNEFKHLWSMGGIMIKLTRNTESNAGNHVSETELSDADWDYIIENDGTIDELEHQVVSTLGFLRNGLD